jgi:hypothetical protein
MAPGEGGWRPALWVTAGRTIVLWGNICISQHSLRSNLTECHMYFLWNFTHLHVNPKCLDTR